MDLGLLASEQRSNLLPATIIFTSSGEFMSVSSTQYDSLLSAYVWETS